MFAPDVEVVFEVGQMTENRKYPICELFLKFN